MAYVFYELSFVPLASFGPTLGSLWLPLGALGLPLAVLWGPFGRPGAYAAWVKFLKILMIIRR